MGVDITEFRCTLGSGYILRFIFSMLSKGHFTHETASPWPLHFKHSHWCKRRSRSEFASHYAWRTDGVCECKMDVKVTWHPMDDASWSLGLCLKTTSWGRPTQNRETIALHMLTTVDLSYFIICENPTQTQIHWHSIWLRARSHMTSHYPWGSVTTLHEFGGVLRRLLNSFCWSLTTSRSRLLARVWSGPNSHWLDCHKETCIALANLRWRTN